jgi:Ulp1 protease family, C-terminal catalytic domain
MTRLEGKIRRGKVKKVVSPAAKFKMQLSLPTKIDLQQDAKPRVNESTEKAIRSEVIDLMKETGSVNLMNMADSLSGSKKIKDAIGRQHPQQNSGLSSVWARLGLGRLWPEKLKAVTDDGVENRYQLTTAFYDLRKSPGAQKTIIESWEQAKMILSTKIEFPEREVGREELLPESEIRPYGKNLDLDIIGSLRYENIQHLPSDEKHTQIKAWRTPRKIEDEKRDQAKQAGPLASEVDSQYDELRKGTKLKSRHIIFDELEGRVVAKEKEEEAHNLASALLRDFTDDEDAIVENSMYGGGAADEIMQSDGADSVYWKSIWTLRPGQWLNDEVIHYFYVMLGKRDEELCRIDPNRKRSHFFKSFFITMLLNEGNPEKHGQYEYRGVKRWSKKVPGKDIFKLDKVFFPINQNGMHWVCAVAFMQEKRIQFYDSMGGGGHNYLKHIFQYIQDEHFDKKKSPLPDRDEWRLVECTDDTPQQKNGKPSLSMCVYWILLSELMLLPSPCSGFDCGVFTCMFADFLSKDCPLAFTQEHVNKCRRRIALSICLGQAIL